MNTQQRSKASRKEWLGLAVIALPCMLYSMDLTVLNLAVPKLTEELHPTSTELLWIVDIYGFMLAGMLITMGTLGDRIGRRKLLMIGATTFGAASTLAAFSNSPETLILSRAILGIAGATLAPSTLSLIRNMFLNDEERTLAIAVWITSYSAGGVIGPVIGGLILEHYHWSSIFLIAIPVMILLLISAPILLPEFKDSKAGKIDLISAFLSLTSVLTFILGIKLLVQDGLGATNISSMITSAILGTLFIRRQKKLAHPLIDLNLFRIKPFTVSLLIYTLGTFILFGNFFFVGQYLQLVLHQTPLISGLWTLPSFAAFIAGSIVTPRLTRRIQPATLMMFGLLICAVGFSILLLINTQEGLASLVTGITIISLGMAPVFTLVTDTIVGSAPPENAGVASSISETGSELGGALGIALLGSIGTLIYRFTMNDFLSGALSVQQHEVAIDTLGGAVSVADQLEPVMSTNLLLTAKDSFVKGFHTIALACAIIALAMAFLTLIIRNASAKPDIERNQPL